jgi:predicted transcriptional regulator
MAEEKKTSDKSPGYKAARAVLMGIKWEASVRKIAEESGLTMEEVRKLQEMFKEE